MTDSPIFHPINFVLLFFTINAITVAILVIMDNRTPSSTMTWILVLTLFPIIGLLVYIFFGRTWKAFSRQRKLTKQEIGNEITIDLAPLMAEHKQNAEAVCQKAPPYVCSLIEMGFRNSRALLTTHNAMQILQDAQEKYPCLIADLEAAQQSIHLEYYIWETDEFTEKIKKILIEKARAGIEVRILYDAFGCFRALTQAYKDELRAAGVEIHTYLYAFSIHNIAYRNHRKLAVIDGKVGYLGGLNLSQEHLTGGKYFDHWRDTHMRVVGDAARVLQGMFLISWYNITGQKVAEQRYFPPAEKTDTCTPMQIIASGPDSQWEAIHQLYFSMITVAQKHIYLQSPFFILDESVSEALKTAALGGLDVRVMIQPRGRNLIASMPYRAGLTYCEEMARAGVRIFLYKTGYFHSKTISIDGQVCSIGTANMDIRSFSLNYEMNAVIYEPGIARELEADFVNDQKDCEEFALASYHKQNPFARFYDSVSRLASPLI
jgi:cardiolipin synthase